MNDLSRLLWPRERERGVRPAAMTLDELATALRGPATSSGVYVSAEGALRASAVWACVRLLAESLASLPLIMYRRTADGGKVRAPEHPLYSILHDQPNRLQSAFAFKRVLMVHALLKGNGYAQIMPGPRGAVDSLVPVYPDAVRHEDLPDGGIRYMVRGADGVERPVNDEDMFHISGLSLDGVGGLSLVDYARESIGLQMAAEGYSARFYAQNAQPGGVLKSAKALTSEAAQRLRASWQAAHAGLSNAHQVAVLEDGLEWQQTGMTHQDAELIAQLDWSSADIARYFNVPLHMIQLVNKSTSWGSGIEEMTIGYVTYSLLPWLRNWEDTIRKDLIIANRTYFAEFLLEGLLRGKVADRYNAYAIGVQNGWLSANDVRRLENMNPISGGETYRAPLNTAPIGEPAAPRGAHYQLLLRETAERVARKETAAMERAARRCEGLADRWETEVRAFYGTHGRFVAETLQIDGGRAEAYAVGQAQERIAGGPTGPSDWEVRSVDKLLALAMEGGDGD